MEPIIFLIVITQMLMIIGLCVMNFKDQLLNFMLGIRRKRAIFIDLRLSKYVTLSVDLKSFEMFGKTFVWNFTKELNGCCFFRSDMVEPVEMSIDVEKCKYWCDSNEYHTNLKNKLLETLMMLKNKDMIINMLMIVAVICFIILALLYFRTNGINESLDTIQNNINALNQTIRPAPDITIK